MPRTNSENKDNRISTGTIVKGMAGVAATAGIVAAGVMLANKKNRKVVGRTIKKGLKSVGELTSQMAEEGKYYKTAGAIAHRVGMSTKRKTQNKNKRAKSSKKA